MPRRLLLALVVVLVLGGLYWFLRERGWIEMLGDEERLRAAVEDLGFWGPVALIGLMTTAIVVSPIPSAPIAMVAGAAYGPAWGTLITVVGAEAGALIAFALARHLGYDVIRRWASVRPVLERLEKKRSQNWLTAAVFVSRLLPFISFDAVSYAAGLTPLAFWRFALATVAGVTPISFLLAYFGDELLTADPQLTLLVAVAVGAITLLPIGYRMLRGRR